MALQSSFPSNCSFGNRFRKNTVFHNMMLCSLLKIQRHFGGMSVYTPQRRRQYSTCQCCHNLKYH